jgi:hypothetical protein
MSRPYLRKIILVAGGIALSAPLTVCLEVWLKLHTPGDYVTDYVFPPRSHPYKLRHVMVVYYGTDFILVFFILTGLYLLFTKLIRRRKQ